jgi:hypothetical protein
MLHASATLSDLVFKLFCAEPSYFTWSNYMVSMGFLDVINVIRTFPV